MLHHEKNSLFVPWHLKKSGLTRGIKTVQEEFSVGIPRTAHHLKNARPASVLPYSMGRGAGVRFGEVSGALPPSELECAP